MTSRRKAQNATNTGATSICAQPGSLVRDPEDKRLAPRRKKARMELTDTVGVCMIDSPSATRYHPPR